MKKLLIAFMRGLGLDENTSEDQAISALNAFFEKAKSDADRATALAIECAIARSKFAALMTDPGSPDPSQYIPISVARDLHRQIAALTKQVDDGLEDVVRGALAVGKLLPMQEAWARDLGKTNRAALKAFIASAPGIAALTGQQTAGREIESSSPIESIDPAFIAVCKMFGNDPNDVLKRTDASLQHGARDGVRASEFDRHF